MSMTMTCYAAVDCALGLLLAILLIIGGALVRRRHYRGKKFLLPATWGGFLLVLVSLIVGAASGTYDRTLVPACLTSSFTAAAPFLLFLGIFLRDKTISAHLLHWQMEQTAWTRLLLKPRAEKASQALAREEPAASDAPTGKDD